MKKFLKAVSEIIRQMDQYGKYDRVLLDFMKEHYQRLSDIERQQGLSLLSELLKEDARTYLYFMSVFLTKLEAEEAFYYITEIQCSEMFSLWERIEMMYQQKAFLFRKSIIKDPLKEYQSVKNVYVEILQDLVKISRKHPWISWKERRKSVALVVRQILGIEHSPTRKMLSVCSYLRTLGYEVIVYVNFFPGQTKKSQLCWYEGYRWNNEMEKTMPFVISIEEDEIQGQNLYLEPENYLYEMEKMTDMIYDQRPEFVFELGDATLLAGMCQEFTTVVTMGCTKTAPVTTAPIIARYFKYSEEEDEDYRKYIDGEQKVIDVKHQNIGEIQLEKMRKIREDTDRLRQELGIAKEQFVILIVGNRLDSEVDELFQNIISQILEQDEKILCVFVGECKELQAGNAESIYKNQIRFLGFRQDFREIMTIGDVFLNPPRQGGGTGALYAALLEIPVITLDHCDVEATVGKSFVCASVEEMPELVSRYMTDRTFYEKRKKEVREYVEKELKVNSVENFKKLCDQVRELTLHMEEIGENGYGK